METHNKNIHKAKKKKEEEEAIISMKIAKLMPGGKVANLARCIGASLDFPNENLASKDGLSPSLQNQSKLNYNWYNFLRVTDFY